jgi:hypothetical protein
MIGLNSFDNADIAWRIKNGGAVSVQELAGHIAEDEAMRFVYMLCNNPASLNDVLRHEKGYGYLPFAPDAKQLMGQIDLLYKKGDKESMDIISDLLAGYRFNPNANNWTTDYQLVENLKTLRVI